MSYTNGFCIVAVSSVLAPPPEVPLHAATHRSSQPLLQCMSLAVAYFGYLVRGATATMTSN